MGTSVIPVATVFALAIGIREILVAVGIVAAVVVIAIFVSSRGKATGGDAKASREFSKGAEGTGERGGADD
ncbi:MAG: hypothetical protein R3F34_05395 [Planctomycetota bacterium]